jgi:hypothetical protein
LDFGILRISENFKNLRISENEKVKEKEKEK